MSAERPVRDLNAQQTSSTYERYCAYCTRVDVTPANFMLWYSVSATYKPTAREAKRK